MCSNSIVLLVDGKKKKFIAYASRSLCENKRRVENFHEGMVAEVSNTKNIILNIFQWPDKYRERKSIEIERYWGRSLSPTKIAQHCLHCLDPSICNPLMGYSIQVDCTTKSNLHLASTSFLQVEVDYPLLGMDFWHWHHLLVEISNLCLVEARHGTCFLCSYAPFFHFYLTKISLQGSTECIHT